MITNPKYKGVPFSSNLHLVNPAYHNNFSTVEGNPITNIFNIDPENNVIEVEYNNNGIPIREWVRPAPNFWAPKQSDPDKLSDEIVYEKLQGVTNPETGDLLFPGDDGYDELHMKQVRGIGNPLFGGVLRDNQYRTQPTNEEANNFADVWVEQTTPGIGTILNAGILKPMDALSFTRLIGGLRGYNVYSEDNPTIFSKEFVRKHPYLTMAGNLVGDIVGGAGVGKVLNLGSKVLDTAYQGAQNYNRARQLSRAINQSVDEVNLGNTFTTKPNTIFRSRVYKGGDVTDPYSTFLTTDPKYASQYGKVTPYLFETKNPAVATEPMIGYRDPVNMDMFVYKNTKDYPGATAIIGHDAVTGEFPYQSNGTEILSLSPNNITKISEPPTINWADVVAQQNAQAMRQSSRILDAKGIGEANPQIAVRTGHRSLSDPDNPFQIRRARLNNKFIGDYDPSTQKLINKVKVRGQDIRNAFKQLDPSLSEDELDLAVQTAFASRRGVHVPIGDNSGRTIGGVSVVDIEETLKYLRESGIINPNADDVGTVVAHEAGHGVKVNKFARDLVKDFKNPDEFYTLVGQVLDDAKITKNEKIPFGRLVRLTDKYLKKKKLDNGITELREYLSNYPEDKRKDLMTAIGRFSAGLFGAYLIGRNQKQNNINK